MSVAFCTGACSAPLYYGYSCSARRCRIAMLQIRSVRAQRRVAHSRNSGLQTHNSVLLCLSMKHHNLKMHRIFGRAKAAAPAPPPPDVNAHMTNLSGQEQQLGQKISDIDKQLMQIKQQMAGKPPAAVQHLRQQAAFLLKRKNMLNQQRSQTQTRAFALEQTQFALQTVQGAKEQAEMMKYTAQQLSTAQKDLNLDELEDLYEDMQEDMIDIQVRSDCVHAPQATMEYRHNASVSLMPVSHPLPPCICRTLTRSCLVTSWLARASMRLI